MSKRRRDDSDDDGVHKADDGSDDGGGVEDVLDGVNSAMFAAAQLGIIERVRLVNFMNHANFEVEFGPNINFIVGENGSGKSAVLVAIAICLGANPRFTSRAQRLGGLVQHGKDSCTVAVTLKNSGPEAFKAGEYGERITIERTINKDAGSTWKLLGANGHVASRLKRDIDQVLDVFGTQVDNPCCVLMQDTAKKFLREAKPESLYDFFLEATQLKRMRDDYKEIRERLLVEARRTLTIKSSAVPELHKRREVLQQEAKLAMQQRKSQEELKTLTAKLAWVIVRAKERELEEVAEQLAGVEAQTLKVTDKRAIAARQEAALSARVQEGERDAAAAAQQVREAEARVEELQKRLAAHERTQTQQRAQMQQHSKAIADAKRRQTTVREEIDAMRSKLADSSDAQLTALAHDTQRRTHELRDAERALAALESAAEEAETRAHAHADTLRSTELALSRARDELARTERMQAATGEGASVRQRLAVYGEHYARIVELIDEHKACFKQPPIGPLGDQVRVKAGMEAYARAVDTALDRHALAFVVDSHADEATLRQLCERARIKTPPMIVQRFQTTRYTIPPANVPSGRTALDALEIAHAMAFNALVDQCSLERVLLVDSLEDAKRAVFRSGDARVLQGIDRDGRRYQLRNGTEITLPPRDKYPPRVQVSAQQQREQWRETLAQRRAAIAQLEEQRRAQLDARKQADAAVAAARARLRSESARVQTLRSERDARESELAAAKSVDHASLIAELERRLQTYAEEQSAAERQLKALADERSGRQDASKPLEEERASALRELEALQAHAEASARDVEKAVGALSNCATALAKIDALLGKYATTAAELTQRTTRLREEVAREEETARRIAAERPALSDEETLERLQRDHRRLMAIVAQGSDGCRPEDEVLSDLNNVHVAIGQVERDIGRLDKLIKKLSDSVEVREKAWWFFLRAYAKRTQLSFTSYLARRRFTGTVTFDHVSDATPGRMHIAVNPNKADWKPADDPAPAETGGGKKKRRSSGALVGDAQTSTQGLSGGERSFSTVSLLLALWDVMEMPFAAMDEFDVFMDQVNRRMAVQMLVEACQDRSERQYIFISPHTTAHIPQQHNVKIIRMRPPQRQPERGQGVLPFGAQ